MSAEHHHAPAEFNRSFAIGIALNTGFVPFEAFYGWKVSSLALLADAGHNLSDGAGLVLSWGGALAGKLFELVRVTPHTPRAVARSTVKTTACRRNGEPVNLPRHYI